MVAIGDEAGREGSNPSSFIGDESLPVENVSWNDIQEFEEQTGITLPTEAQWEYACRAGMKTPFAGNLDDMAWYGSNSKVTTYPVGQKKPNDFGLHDMHGNVLEWCEDIYDTTFYSKAEAAGPDPVCKAGSGGRVFRGGGWNDDAGGCRSAERGWAGPSDRDDLGFRPARPST